MARLKVSVGSFGLGRPLKARLPRLAVAAAIVLALAFADGRGGPAAAFLPGDTGAVKIGLRMTAPGQAGTWRQTAAGSQTLAQNRGRQHVPLSVVLANIRSRYPGKLLNARASGNYYYVIWLTPDGRRLDITADARTGNIVGVRGG